jgi:hypothetical protein
MVKKFVAGTWYKVDLLMDWEGQTVTVYVNNTQLASDKFFTNSKTTIASANAIVLYNLTPGGRCRVKKMMVCQERCDSQISYAYAFGEMLRKVNVMLLLALLSFVYVL